jgi:hypothetical protein
VISSETLSSTSALTVSSFLVRLPWQASTMSRLTVGATQSQVGGKGRVLRQEVLLTLNGVLSAVGSVTGQSTAVGGHNGIEEVLQLPDAR